MSATWTSVTLPTGSKRSSSSCVSRCCAKARGQPAGTSAAVAAASWRKSRLEIIASLRNAAKRAQLGESRMSGEPDAQRASGSRRVSSR